MATAPQPLGPPTDDGSPFSALKRRQNEGMFVLRTESLDDKKSELNWDEQDATTDECPATALHTSFDAACLHDSPVVSSPYPSDDELDRSELSGRKHTRHVLPGIAELNPPGTVRKQARTISKTPVRPRLRPPGAMKKASNTTPSSAAKRRRGPPVLGVLPPPPIPSQLASPPSTTVKKLDGSIFGRGVHGSLFPASPPPTHTPNMPTGPFGTQSLSKYHNTTATGTTAASTALETTLGSTDSIGTSSPTTSRFRFTSFPASLPRLQNPPSRDCPDSLRKRIPFTDQLQGTPSSSHQPQQTSDLNQSRDDDGTHNTSISSLSAEGGHQHMAMPPGAASLPPSTILDMHTTERDTSVEEEDANRPIHAKLFAEDEEFGYSDDDDDEEGQNHLANMNQRSVGGDENLVKRTRLNFNSVLSPDKGLPPQMERKNGNVDLTSTYAQKRINSFQSSLSSTTVMSSSVIGGLSPLRPADNRHHSMTPREVQVHFPPEDECSPIPAGFQDHPASPRIEIQQPMPSPRRNGDTDMLDGPALLPRTKVPDTAMDCSASTKDGESSTGSTSANGKSRRRRPMPDMSAFESHAVSSRGERSSDDSATLDSKGAPSAQRRVCPPTPVRTPAWANENGSHKYFGRQSSLITTKLLLSVPSQVVEGRCSLENSMLDDDSKSSLKGGSTVKKESSKPARMSIENLSAPSLRPVPVSSQNTAGMPLLKAPPRVLRQVPAGNEVDSIVSFANDFEILSNLGSGAFADVYKVRSVKDNKLYAVKRNRRQFRGKRDRDMALTEVQAMQKLQSVCADSAGSGTPQMFERSSYSLYLLFFYRAWQEDGHFLCQTELCCRDTCRELLDSLRFLWNTAKNKYPSLLRNLPLEDNVEPGSMEDSTGRMMPTMTVWKICHDIAAGLSHIHSHGMVHHDIKPSNVFFVPHPRLGAMCKIGDFGMAGEIGTSADGLEGDTCYMPPELLASGKRHPQADIFSLGLTIFEIATDVQMEMPSDGPHWHYLRSKQGPNVPPKRGEALQKLVLSMTDPDETKRPNADAILDLQPIRSAGHCCDEFLRDYIHDIDVFDRMEEDRLAMDNHEDQTPRNSTYRPVLSARSPSLSMLLSNPPALFSPAAVRKEQPQQQHLHNIH